MDDEGRPKYYADYVLEELEDEQRFLEDKVADLRHELKNLAGEK